METLESATPSSSKSENSDNRKHSLTSSPLPPSVARLWRPAAQRNLRNQWSKLAAYRKQWTSSSSAGRSHATSLINAYLSQTYMPSMDLGVLSNIAGIREKASQKLYKQQELHRRNLLSSYKDMVTVVTHLVETSKFMRCYQKGASSSPLVQFSGCSEDKNDSGDGGGIPVFTFWSISWFEKLAEELVSMIAQELMLKRLLVLEFLSIGCEEVSIVNRLNWSDELYPGEFDDLSTCNLYSGETRKPIYPRLHVQKSDIPAAPCSNQPNQERMQVYLTTWLAEVNIDTNRVDEIIAMIGEEMHASHS